MKYSSKAGWEVAGYLTSPQWVPCGSCIDVFSGGFWKSGLAGYEITWEAETITCEGNVWDSLRPCPLY